ncbi:hypothetical protein [Streptomyces sp. ODS28]|uniref:hypothetical protein n=1 Tax=Streptomyces sp. ODS28 TaxID=3136688 RepID=UPI0031E73694
MNPLAAAALLQIVSAVCYAAAAIAQEHLATTVRAQHRWTRLRHLLASSRWWVAVALQGLGALLHTVALGVGPLTVVQPLGVLTLVLAAPMAAVFVKRPVGAAGWRGILLTSTGLAGILLLTGAQSSMPNVLSGSEQVGLAVGVAIALTVLIAAGAAAGWRLVVVRSLALATASGIAYGSASVYVKTLADTWKSLDALALLALILLIVALAVTGLGASQASYRGAGLTVPLATATVVNPVMAALVGTLMMGESFRFGLAGQLGAVAAGLVAALGLTLLAANSSRPRRDEATLSPVVIHSPGAEQRERQGHAGRRRYHPLSRSKP